MEPFRSLSSVPESFLVMEEPIKVSRSTIQSMDRGRFRTFFSFSNMFFYSSKRFHKRPFEMVALTAASSDAT